MTEPLDLKAIRKRLGWYREHVDMGVGMAQVYDEDVSALLSAVEALVGALETLAVRLRTQAACHYGDEHPQLEDVLIDLARWAEVRIPAPPGFEE